MIYATTRKVLSHRELVIGFKPVYVSQFAKTYIAACIAILAFVTFFALVMR